MAYDVQFETWSKTMQKKLFSMQMTFDSRLVITNDIW